MTNPFGPMGDVELPLGCENRELASGLCEDGLLGLRLSPKRMKINQKKNVNKIRAKQIFD